MEFCSTHIYGVKKCNKRRFCLADRGIVRAGQRQHFLAVPTRGGANTRSLLYTTCAIVADIKNNHNNRLANSYGFVFLFLFLQIAMADSNSNVVQTFNLKREPHRKFYAENLDCKEQLTPFQSLTRLKFTI